MSNLSALVFRINDKVVYKPENGSVRVFPYWLYKQTFPKDAIESDAIQYYSSGSRTGDTKVLRDILGGILEPETLELKHPSTCFSTPSSSYPFVK